MQNRPKTIKIFLPEGSATGIKEAELTNRLILATSIPRSKLNEVQKRDAFNHTGIYFLFGQNIEDSEPIVYIGQAENCMERIKAHNRNKDFWNNCVLITSKTNGFTKTAISFLEYYAIKKSNEIKRYQSDNQATPKKPSINESDEADLLDNFDTIRILLSTLGHPIFEETRKENLAKSKIYYCKGKDAIAKGEYKEDGFVILEGSIANLAVTKSAGTWVTGMREKLKKSGKLIQENEILVLKSDHVFGSPSAAAACMLGRRANGWLEWKNKEGITLDQIERKE
tara:strand:- start:74 stop:922 length:849 start_codon:yes stop_codon:yes gene_type:complete